jgi:hypothetical protein
MMSDEKLDEPEFSKGPLSLPKRDYSGGYSGHSGILTGLYFLAALIMKPAPVLRINSDDAHDFYNSYVHSRPRAVDRIKRRYDNIEQRIRRMEDAVTSRDYDWERRFDS